MFESYVPPGCTPNSAGAEIGRYLGYDFLLPLSANAPSYVAFLRWEYTDLGLKMVYHKGLVDSGVSSNQICQ